VTFITRPRRKIKNKKAKSKNRKSEKVSSKIKVSSPRLCVCVCVCVCLLCGADCCVVVCVRGVGVRGCVGVCMCVVWCGVWCGGGGAVEIISLSSLVVRCRPTVCLSSPLVVLVGFLFYWRRNNNSLYLM
jgi:hypothetical protein